MDRARDALKLGDFGSFFSMDGNTATYVGAAIAGFSALQALLSSDAQRQCVEQAVTELKVEETSKKLVAQRTVNQNATKLQRTVQTKCEKVKKRKKKIDGCTSGLDLAGLRDNPLRSLGGLFSGIFGGDVADSLLGTSGNFGDVLSSKSNLGIANGEFGRVGTTIASNVAAAKKVAGDAVADATKSVAAAKQELAKTVNEVEGFKADATESLDQLQKKAKAAKRKVEKLQSAGQKAASGDIAGALEDAGVQGEIAGINVKQAQNKITNLGKAKDIFDSKGATLDSLKKASSLFK